MRTTIAVLLAVALAGAQGVEYDDDTLAGMDAEVRGDWVEAVRAFARAEENRARGAGARLRYARRRAAHVLGARLEALLEAGAHAAAARTIALMEFANLRHRSLGRARRTVERAGVEIRPIPAESPADAGPYGHRSGRARELTLAALGATGLEAERIVEGCRAFLVKHQEKDGSWAVGELGGTDGYQVGLTSLALLALLSDGPSALEGDAGAAARRARDYLVSRQSAKGDFGERQLFKFHYNDFFASEALAEYAVLADDKTLRPHLVKARDMIVAAQKPDSGWRYDPRPVKPDTSLTGRAIVALKALERAGLEVPKSAYRGAANWIREMHDVKYGMIGYDQHGGTTAREEGLPARFPPEHSAAMTSVGLLTWVYAGESPDDMKRAVAHILELPPQTRYPDFYYWMSGTRALRAAGATIPAAWYRALVDGVRAARGDDGGVTQEGPWTESGGRVYATAACALALAAPYREADAVTRAQPATWFFTTARRDVRLAGSPGEIGTGCYLDAGMRVSVEPSGSVLVHHGGQSLDIDGFEDAPKSLERRLKRAPFGCLLGRIGPDGKLFRVRRDKPIVAKQPGELFLLVNDADVSDNSPDRAWNITLKLEE